MFTLEATDIWSNLFAAGAQVSIISDLFRHISYFLDSVIYGLVPIVFDLIYKLYDINNILKNSNEIISTTSKSIYSLLAIYMFFSVSFSLLGMLVDPAMIDNKDKGAGKIVSNIVVCIVLLVMVPYIFDFASMAQAKIMEDQLIEKAIYGENFNKDNNYTLGNRLALSTWAIFLEPTTDKGAAVEAYNDTFEQSEGSSGFWYNNGLGTNLNKTTGVFGFLAKFPGLNAVFRMFGSTNRYQLSYIIFISTAAGVYLLWSMVKLCIDIAYRSIKMFALQILAPIAIMSYINPKSSKDGSVFSKWVKEAVKTYTSLFVRIFIFAFASLLALELDLNQVNTAGGTNTLLGYFSVRLMYILAIVAFIKAAPKFIDGILGTELAKESETKFAHNLLKSGLARTAAAATIAAGTIASGKVAGASRGDIFKKTLANMSSAGKTAADAAKKNDFRGVIGAFNPDKNDLGKTRKDWKIPTKLEEAQRERAIGLSDMVDAAQEGKLDGIKGSNQRLMDMGLWDAVNKKVSGDALTDYIQKTGFKDPDDPKKILTFDKVSGDDKNAQFFINKLLKKKSTGEALKAAGMSDEGRMLFDSAADSEYVANMTKMQYDAVSAIQQRKDNAAASASSASMETVRAAGFTKIEEYVADLEKKADDYRKGDFAKTSSDYNKYSKAAKKAETEMKNFFASREGLADGTLFNKFQEGEYATGRDADGK